MFCINDGPIIYDVVSPIASINQRAEMGVDPPLLNTEIH